MKFNILASQKQTRTFGLHLLTAIPVDSRLPTNAAENRMNEVEN